MIFFEGRQRGRAERKQMRKLILMLGIIFIFAPFTRGQDDEKIKQLFQDAIEAMGGSAYLNVTDMVAEGNYFFFDLEGNSSGLIKFIDSSKIPDKSRTEVGNRKSELEITVYNLEKNEGWIVEGQKGTREANQDEMKNFRNSVKHSIDVIFRVRYKDPQNRLFYLGPGEGQDVTLEMTKIIDPENDEVTVYFDRISKLPAKIEYRSINKKGIRQRSIQEFSQWHVIQNVKTPLRTDSYVNGRRSSQLFINKISYNNNLPDTFFSKPIPPK
jgi:hypothetical protein